MRRLVLMPPEGSSYYTHFPELHPHRVVIFPTHRGGLLSFATIHHFKVLPECRDPGSVTKREKGEERVELITYARVADYLIRCAIRRARALVP